MQPDSLDENDLDRFCESFARKCRNRENPRIEDWLRGHSEPLRTVLLTRLLKLEWQTRKELGDAPNAQDLVERFPDQQGLISSLAADDEPIQLTPDLRYEQGSNQITLVSAGKSTRRGLDGPTNPDRPDAATALSDPTSVREMMDGDATLQQTAPPTACSVQGPEVQGPEMKGPEVKGPESKGPESKGQNAGGKDAKDPPSRPTRYMVQGEVGRGGMGIVYRARDEKLGRSLAIKVLQPSDSQQSISEQQREVARFLDEAKLSAQLDHPGLVPVHELDHDPKLGFYFTMRLVKGKHLGEISKLAREQKDGWNLPRVVGVIVKACEAVAYAHSKNVIHRDLKPANVMVGRFGAVYVMDWGLAKVVGQADLHDLRPQIDTHSSSYTVIQSERHGSGESTADTPLITMDGSVIGTPAYMPPEQAKGMIEEVDDKADIYSLGAILYHLLTGQPPYVESGTRLSPHTILGMVIQGPPERVKKLNPEAPAELVAICEKAMARNKSERYLGSLDMAEDLQAYLDGRVVRAYRTGAIAELRSWVSRNRATAVAGIGVVLAVVSGLLGVVGVQKVSSGKIRTAREETRRYLYDGNIQLVQQAWENGAVFRARELLDRHLPNSGESDLRSFAWYYFDNLCRQSEEAPLLPHDDIVTSIDFSVQGDRIATGCNDGVVRLWNPDDWTMQRLPGQHQRKKDSPQFPAVDHLTFTPDGAKVISVGRFGDVIVREPAGEAEPRLLDEAAYPWSMDVSASGRYLAAPDNQQKSVLIWDIGKDVSLAKVPRRFAVQENESDQIQAIHFSADEESFFTLGTAGVAKRWRVSDGELMDAYGEPTQNDVPVMDVSRSGNRLAVNQGSEIMVWDLPSGELIGRSSGPVFGMKHIVFSNSGDYVAACGLSEAGEVMVWKIEPNQLRLISSGNRHRGRISRMASLGKGKEGFVTAGGNDNVVKVWDFSTGELVSTFRGHQNEIYGLATSPDGRFVATGGRGQEVRVWDLDKTPSTSVLAAHGGTVWSGAISPNGELVCTASADGNLRAWDARTGELLGAFRDRRPEAPENSSAHSNSAQFVRFLPSTDGDQLVSCGKDGHIKLWSVSRRELIGQITAAHEHGTNCLAFSADGKKLISCGDDGRIKVWNRAELYAFNSDVQPLRVIGPIGQAVWGLACSPTANLVAAAGKVPDHKIFVWDLDSDAEPTELVGHTNNVTFLAFSEDGKTLASTSQDSSARLWDVASSAERPAPQSPLRGHSGDVQSLVFTPDGRSIITASMDQTIRIWDRQTGESKCTLPGHTAGVQHVTISDDGTTLLSASWDQTARLWRAPRP